MLTRHRGHEPSVSEQTLQRREREQAHRAAKKEERLRKRRNRYQKRIATETQEQRLRLREARPHSLINVEELSRAPAMPYRVAVRLIRMGEKT